jgi:hypothetical protein
VWDLLHGLMLPSGNDAAITLAEYFGGVLLKKDDLDDESPSTNQIIVHSTSTTNEFIRQPSQPSNLIKYESFLE